jgi:hypothetical protein
MSETLVAVAVGAVSAGLAWAFARWSGPAGTTRHRAVLFFSFVILFTLGSATRPDRILLDLLMPHARAWKQEREVAALLDSEPLFVAVIADEPALREPLRAGLLKALRDGERGEAVLAGQRLLSPQLWRYVPRATDAAALGLGQALVATLTDLQARDPQQCYRFLFPAVAGPAGSGASARDDGLLAALRAVVESARDGSAGPLDRRAARRDLDAAFGRLRARHGSDVDVLRDAQAPGADRARVCAMTIALYSELVALPPAAAGRALRHVLGPAEPAGAARLPPAGR